MDTNKLTTGRPARQRGSNPLTLWMGLTLLASVALSPHAYAEVITINGVNPCPNHNAQNTSWSEAGGCHCDAGWVGSSCNTPANWAQNPVGAAGAAFGSAANYVGGLIRNGGVPIKNPYLRRNVTDFVKPGHYRYQVAALMDYCKQARGDHTLSTQTGKVTITCDLPNRADRECARAGVNYWICGDVDPTRSRVRSRRR